MSIINLDKKTCLATQIRLANTPVARLRGLLGQKEIKSNEAMWIRPCKAIHTIGLRFSIDVIFLDQKNRVIQLIPHMKKNRLTPLKIKAKSVLELFPGSIADTGTNIGDRLLIEIPDSPYSFTTENPTEGKKRFEQPLLLLLNQGGDEEA